MIFSTENSRMATASRLKFTVMLISLIAITFMLAVAGSCAEGARVLKFAQLSDVHISVETEDDSERMHVESADILLDVIDQINNMGDIDFVVITGDLIDKSRQENFDKFAATIAKLKVPWYWTTGNHDLAKGFKRNEFREKLNAINPTFKPSTMSSSVVENGVLLLFLDGADSEITGMPQGFFTKPTLAFLESELTAHQDKPALIFQHFPIVYPIATFDHGVKNQAEYLRILKKHPNADALFAGHFHVSKIEWKNNVLHVTAPAMIQYPNAFRVVTLTQMPEGLQIDLKVVPTRLESVRQHSREASPMPDICAGRPEDQDFTAILK